MPLRALPFGQVVRLVFPMSQVLGHLEEESQMHRQGWAPGLKGWPASVALLSAGCTLDKCWARLWGEGPPDHSCLPASGLALW